MVEYLPASQSLHAPGPLETLYLPRSHDEQGPPLLPDAPALHLQSDRLSLPDGESECKGHAVHTVLASADANVPGAHFKHAAEPFAGLKLPATHALHAPCKMGKGAHRSKYEMLRLLALLELLTLAYMAASLSTSEEIAPVYPALHKHCAGDADPGRESECSGHCSHVLS